MPSFFTPQRLTMLIFFLQPIAFGAWLPRIPDVQAALGLGPQALAIALIGLPCGTLLTLPFAGPLVGKIGAKSAIAWGFIAYAIAVSLPAFATSVPTLFVALMLVGSTISFVELGLNVMADRVEKETQTTIMSRSHGFWSLGIMAGSAIGALLAGVGIDAKWAILAMVLVTLPPALIIAAQFANYGQERHAGVAQQRSSWGLPSLPLLGISLFVFGITMTEGAMADWSAVFLRGVFNAPAAEAGFAYSVFAFMVATGRFGGDYLRKRFGDVALARAFGLLALAGITILLSAPTTPIAMIGLAVAGLGVSVGFPLAVTAAARLTDRPSSANVAVLSFIALLGFLVGPPVIGFIAEHVQMRFGLAALLPMLAISLAVSGLLAPKAPAGPAPGVASQTGGAD